MIAFAWAWAWIATAAPLPRELGDDAPVEGEATEEAGEAEGDTGTAPEAAVEAPPPEPELPATPQGRPSFLAGDRLTIDGSDGDLLAIARGVTVAGPLADNTFLLGQEVNLNDEVRGDAMLVGQSVRVRAPVLGDLYAVAAGEIRLDAPVYGNVYLGGRRVVFADDVYGVVEASAGEIELSGHLHRDVSLQFASAKVLDGAHVEGDLDYVAPRQRDDFGDVVDGTARFKFGDFDVSFDPSDPMGALQDLVWRVVSVLQTYVGLLATGGVLLLIAGPFMRGPSKAASEQPLMSAALGFVAVLVTPVAATAAALLFVTLPLGLVTLALWLVGLVVAQLFTASAVGHLINRRLLPSLEGSDLAALATGLVPLAIASAFPQIVFLIVYLLASFVGFGALWLYWRDEARDRRLSRRKAKE